MSQSYLWCGNCHRAIASDQVRREFGGSICPGCNKRLNRASMERFICPECGSEVHCSEEDRKEVVCPCQLQTPSRPEAAPDAATADQAAPAPLPALETRPVQAPQPEPVPEEAGGPVSMGWEPVSADELAYRHPRGARLQMADAVVVRKDQCVRFIAGGQTHWFKKPGTYSLGYEYRDEATVLRALMAGENLGLQPMLHSEVVFIDLRRHDGLMWEPDTILLGDAIGLRPRLRYALTIANPEALMSQAFDEGVPTLAAVTAHLHARMRKLLLDWLGSRCGHEVTADAARLELKEHGRELADALMDGIAYDSAWGLRVDELTLEGCAVLRVEVCPVCGTLVADGASACPRGHAVQRCPLCGGMLRNGRCGQGHWILWCQYCNARVISPDGRRCPVHGTLV